MRAMRDSDTYQAIVEEGRVLQAREDILCLAEKRLGPGDKVTLDRPHSTTALGGLKRIYERVLDATDWQDLLDTP
jgi:hypothetical protein